MEVDGMAKMITLFQNQTADGFPLARMIYLVLDCNSTGTGTGLQFN